MQLISIYYGPQFSETLVLNATDNHFLARSSDLFGGPDQDIVLSDSLLSNPYFIRAKLKERVFSLAVMVRAERWSRNYNLWRGYLLKRLYSGEIRLGVYRLGLGEVYLTCSVDGVTENNETGDLTVKLTRPDPIFTKSGLAFSATRANAPGPPYADVDLSGYSGSAPAEPVITIAVDGGGEVYRKYKLISITNPNSNVAFHYYPVCIDLGDLSAQVLPYVGGGSGPYSYHEIGVNSLGLPPHEISDIRLESPGGRRKQIFIRDSGDNGGTWHQEVKVWTILYSLRPGETKVLRLLYDNPDAVVAEVWPESNSIRPMFNMYLSTNVQWYYRDFAPAWNGPQTRCSQWVPYIPGAANLAWISFQHPAFPASSADNIGGAAGYVTAYAPVAGRAGMQLLAPVDITSVQFNYRLGTNFKTPMVLRAYRPNGRETDDWVAIGPKARRLYLATGAITGRTTLTLGDVTGSPTLTQAESTIAAGDWLLILLNDGTTCLRQVRTCNLLTGVVTLAVGLPGAAGVGNTVQQSSLSTTPVTIAYASGDRPRTVAFALRGDRPDLTSGSWYFGGSEEAWVNLASAQVAQVSIGAEVTIALAGQSQIKGTFGNPRTGEYLNINTVLKELDHLVIDCPNRQVLYYEYDLGSGTYLDPVDRFDALTFTAVGQYWIHIDPTLSSNRLEFFDDTRSNFRNTTITAVARERYF